MLMTSYTIHQQSSIPRFVWVFLFMGVLVHGGSSHLCYSLTQQLFHHTYVTTWHLSHKKHPSSADDNAPLQALDGSSHRGAAAATARSHAPAARAAPRRSGAGRRGSGCSSGPKRGWKTEMGLGWLIFVTNLTWLVG